MTVVAGDRSYVKVNDGKTSYLGQSRVPLYFGLGEATGVDRIDVEWPSGAKQTVEPEGINRRIDIVEAAVEAAAD